MLYAKNLSGLYYWSSYSELLENENGNIVFVGYIGGSQAARARATFLILDYDTGNILKQAEEIENNSNQLLGFTNIIKESGFNKVARVGRTNMMDVKIPKPTFEQLEQMSEKVDQLRTTAINKATAIKADSLQRIKAAMDKEYVEAPEAKQATEQIEIVLREVALHIQVIGRIKQKKMLKDQFVWEDKEKRLLLEPLMTKGLYRGIVK